MSRFAQDHPDMDDFSHAAVADYFTDRYDSEEMR